MFRKYVLVNTLTGFPCYVGRRFFTIKGATRAAVRLNRQLNLGPFLELRKIIF